MAVGPSVELGPPKHTWAAVADAERQRASSSLDGRWHPNRYASRHAFAAKTRAQVIAESKEAGRNGDVVIGDAGLTDYELHPQNCPTRVFAKGKTRDEVRAELVDAIRTGDMVAWARAA